MTVSRGSFRRPVTANMVHWGGCASPAVAWFCPPDYLESLLITLIKAPFSSFSLWLSAFKSGNIYEEKRKKFHLNRKGKAALFTNVMTSPQNKWSSLSVLCIPNVYNIYYEGKTLFVNLISLTNDGMKFYLSKWSTSTKLLDFMTHKHTLEQPWNEACFLLGYDLRVSPFHNSYQHQNQGLLLWSQTMLPLHKWPA